MAKAPGLPPATSPPYRVVTVPVEEILPLDYIFNRAADRPGEFWARVTSITTVAGWVAIEAGKLQLSLFTGDLILACHNR